MKELPGDVFIGGQILPLQMEVLAGQGVMTFINNRPDMEAHLQPLSETFSDTAQTLGVDYQHIPMAGGGLTPSLIKATQTAYAEMPRPIFAFCASGMRSAALWCFAHVEALGVDTVLKAVSDIGYNLESLRAPLDGFVASNSTQQNT